MPEEVEDDGDESILQVDEEAEDDEIKELEEEDD